MTTKKDLTKVIPIIDKYFVLTGLAIEEGGLQYHPTAIKKFRTGVNKLNKLRLSTSGKKDVALLIESFEHAADSAEKIINGQDDKESRRKMREAFGEYQRRCEDALIKK